MRRFADAVEERRKREVYLLGVAVRCGGATAEGWTQFETNFKPD